MVRRILVLLLLSAAARPVSGQGLRFTADGSLSLAGGTEHKAVVGQEQEDDTIFLADFPAFSLWSAGPRGYFAASWRPEWEYFDRHSHFTSWNHAARLYFTYAVSPRFRFELGDAAMSTKDPSRHLANSFLLLPRSRYKSNSAFAGFDVNFTPLTTWSTRYDHFITKYGLPDELRAGFFDQTGSSILTSLSHRIAPMKKVAGTYAFVQSKVLGDINAPSTGAATDSTGAPALQVRTVVPTHLVSGSYTEAISPSLAYAVSSGVLFSFTNTWSLSAAVEKRMRDIWLTGGYTRSVSFLGGFAPTPVPSVAAPFASGLQTSNVYELISAGLRGKLSRRVGFEARGTGSRNAAKMTGDGRQSRSLTGRLRLDYELTDRVFAFVSAEFYNQNLNHLIGVPIGRRRYLWGLEISMTPRDRTRELEIGMDSTSLAPFVTGPPQRKKEEEP